MPWSNQSGGGGGPWGRPGGGNGGGPWGGGGGGKTPPDLEDLLRRGQDRLRGVMPGGGFGGGKGILVAPISQTASAIPSAASATGSAWKFPPDTTEPSDSTMEPS